MKASLERPDTRSTIQPRTWIRNSSVRNLMLSKGECKHLQLGLLVILFSVIVTDATFGHDGVHSTISNRKYAYSLAFGSYQRPSITTTNKSNSRNSKISRFHYKDQSMEDENNHQRVDSTHKGTTDALMNAFLLRKINGKNQPLSQPRNRHSNRTKTNVRNEQSRNRKYNKTSPQRAGGRQQQAKPYHQAKYRSHFTEFQIAPALQLVDPPSPPSSSQTFDRNQVYSPVVLEHTREECVDYICGPLAVTYTNDDDSVRLWIEENVYATGTDTQNDEKYRFVGFDVEVSLTKICSWIKSWDMTSSFVDIL